MALTSVVGESWPRLFLRWGLPRWSFFGWAEEACWVEDVCFPLDVSAGAVLVDLFFPPESFSTFLADLFPWIYLESMSRILEKDWKIAFTFALTTFSMASSQEFISQLQVSNWAQIKGFRLTKKHQIMISSFGVAARLNSRKIACNCFRWAAQSRTSSCW